MDRAVNPLLVLLAGCAGAPDSGDTAPATASDVTLGPVQACTAPADAPGWRDATPDFPLPGTLDPDGDHDDSGPLVVHDFDGDGQLDLAFSYKGEAVEVWRGDAGGLTADTPTPRFSASGPAVVDIDGDGDLDATFGTSTADSPMIPLRAEGGWVVPGPAIDLDLQPGVDIKDVEPLWFGGAQHLFLVSNSDLDQPPSVRADQLVGLDGVPVAALPVDAAGRAGFDAVSLDADGDGDLDLYVVNDHGAETGGDVLWRNDGDTLTPLTDGLPVHGGMGADAGDVDGDGREDVLLASTGSQKLLVSLGDGRFADASAAWGLLPYESDDQMGWGAVLADLDNDGALDAAFARGDRWRTGGPGRRYDEPVELRFQRDGAFAAAVEADWIPRGSWRSIVPADLNGDGVLDLVVGAVREPPRFLLSTGCTAAGWVEVRAPLGAHVRLVADDGRTQVRTIRSSSSFAAARTPAAWFGLGAAGTVTALDITLPDGTVVSADAPFAGRRRVTVGD